MLTHRTCFIHFIPLLTVLQGTVLASELVGSLKPGSSDTFANYKYHTYQFSLTSVGKFYIVMRSKMFDPYLMIIGPVQFLPMMITILQTFGNREMTQESP